MIILQCNQLTKHYGVETILENISLLVGQGEKIGLVGPNGVGKTTLLKLIVGEEAADEGTIVFGRDIRVGYLAQTTSFFEGHKALFDFVLEEYADLLAMRVEVKKLQHTMAQPDVYENSKRLEDVMKAYAQLEERYEREGGYSFESKIRGVLIGLGFQEEDLNRTLGTFSGGQKTRIALAKILLRSPELLILDEPTNYLDLKAVEWLESYLSNYPGAILLVSHDRYFLDQVTEKTFALSRRGITSYSGNYSRYLVLKEQADAAHLKAYEKQREDIQRQETFIRKYRAGIKSKQARGRESILNRLERLEKPDMGQKKAAFGFHAESRTGEMVLEASQLTMAYPGNPLFTDLHISLWKGDKVALIGDNGTGKTTLLKILAGNLKNSMVEEAKIRWGARVKLAYFSQEHEDLTLENTVVEELWMDPRLTEHEVRTVLGTFQFKGEQGDKKVSALSGGERSRLMLAKLFLQGANVLILDEPTNHLDIETREVLEEALQAFSGNLLFVSHDRYFINKLTNRVLELEGGVLKEYLGNFDYYKWKKREVQLDLEAKKQAEEEERIRKKKKDRKRKTDEKKQQDVVQLLEEEIEALENEIARLGEVLSDVSLYDNPEAAKEHAKEYQLLQDRLERLYQKWEGEIALQDGS